MKERIPFFLSGIPQLLDAPALLKKHYPDYLWTANSPSDYSTMFTHMRHNKAELYQQTLMALQATYKQHTVFDRCCQFFSTIWQKPIL